VTVSKVSKICESLRALRRTQPHQVGYRFVDVAASITFWMLSQMTQHRMMEGGLRRER